ncbi:CNP1-like family protein [Paludibacterium sp. THUN1379]|uniref:CNP1-like family protein n=1 Tax=Paludibacterium sp. THUN1379 TaxID=3112107 RepID=UPI003087FE34|nr:CNP1-like family protein [Paludibacterium sp. THUN1379]
MRIKLLVASLACCLLAHGALANPATRDYKPINNGVYAFEDTGPWKEGEYTVPPYPDKPDWVGFFVPLKKDYHFYVDGKSLSVGSDEVVRFTLRVVSATGAENVSYEGIHCRSRETRPYAFGDTVGMKWYESRRSVWRRVNEDDMTRLRLAEDLCVDWQTPADAATALTLLKKAPWL